MKLLSKVLLIIFCLVVQSFLVTNSQASMLLKFQKFQKSKFECVAKESNLFIPQGVSISIDLNNSKEFYILNDATKTQYGFDYVEFKSSCKTCLEASFRKDQKLWQLFLVPIPARPSPNESYELYLQNDQGSAVLSCREV